MNGVEESVENYRSYLVACCMVLVFESYEILFFSFCHSYLNLSHDFMLTYAFTHILSVRILLFGKKNV